MKRNGLSASVARGRNRRSASACSSPWLMTPSAAPSTPSTATPMSTRRDGPVPSRTIGSSSTFDCWRRSSQSRWRAPAMARTGRASGGPAGLELLLLGGEVLARASSAMAARAAAEPGGEVGRQRTPDDLAPASCSAATAVARVARRRGRARWSPRGSRRWRCSSSRRGRVANARHAALRRPSVLLEPDLGRAIEDGRRR